jgi:hypothetical protein
MSSSIDPTWFPEDYTFFPWKGKTFAQITTLLKRNKNSNRSFANSLLPNPVTRQYRREIGVIDPLSTSSQRVSQSIDELDQPGGSMVLPIDSASCKGLQGIVDPLLPNDQTHLSTACTTCNANPDNCTTSSTDSFHVCFTDESKARRRCRSAGMIQKHYKAGNNNDSAYFTDSKQYLTSRNRLFSQNQYNYLRVGSSVTVPGTPLAVNNAYSPNGLSHCPQYSISAVQGNNQFSYKWDNSNNLVQTVTIPDGSYSIETFQLVLQQYMTQHGHYFINPADNTFHYLIQFSFDTLQGRVNLELLPPSTYSGYTYAGLVPLATNYVPQIHFLSNGLEEGLGFLTGSYLPVSPQTTRYTTTALNRPLLLPNYVSVIYKPNNPRFAQQGGVSSSSYVSRIKYETVNTTAAKSGPPSFGQEVANELAYGTPFIGYTTKDKVGFPNTATPVIKPNGQLRSCQSFIYRYS